MSLQGWQTDVLRQAFGLSSAHCASSEGCACDRASYMSLQEWQADVVRQAFGLSSAHCASSAAVNVTGPVSIYVIYSLISSSEGLQPGTLLFLTLSSFLLKDVNVIGLEIIYIYMCRCKGG